MEIYAGLQQLGFTEYEARAYVALLEVPGSSGYEVSQRSGLPRSRVYEVLQSLVRKGAATATKVDGKLTYHPLDHELLLRRCQQHITGVITDLQTQLTQLGRKPQRDSITAISGHEQLLLTAQDLCRGAHHRLLIGGLPPELEQLGPELAAAEMRGVKVFVLSYGPCDLPLEHVFEHNVSPLQNLQVAVAGRFLGLVADYRHALLMVVPGYQDQATGVAGENLGLVQALTLWLQHDIQVMEISRYLDPGQLDRIPPEVNERLLAMSTLEPGELGDGYDTQDLPTPSQLLQAIQNRIQADPLTYQRARGSYSFDLRGRNGGQWHLSIHTAGGTLVEGGAEPDLTLRMSARDFSALVVGALPAIALLERNRVSISGDLERSSQLQLILKGAEGRSHG